jgi:4-amino-4-deoxy-L-arabinose transferase-like glycosyltransferase
MWAATASVAGLALRLWFIAHLPVLTGDTLTYGDIAKNLIRHGVYGFTDSTVPGGVRPTLIRLPGYPLFLAACFRLFGMEHYHAVMNVQAGIDLLTCWLVFALARRLFGDRAGLAVLWLAALCPFTANYVASPLTESLVLATIALAFYGFARWQDAGHGANRWLWLIASALTASLLLRPEQGILAAAVVPAMLWRSLHIGRKRNFKACLPVIAAALCVLTPLVPWTIRNRRTFHVLQPLAPRYANDPGELAPLGFARWYRTWAIDFVSTYDVYWNYTGDRIYLPNIPQRAFAQGTFSDTSTADVRLRTAALIAAYNTSTASTSAVTPAIDARFAALAAQRIRAHPVLYYAGLPLARLLDMMLRPRTEMMNTPLEWWHWRQDKAANAFAAGYALLNFAYFALGIAGFFVWKRRRWRSPAGGRYPELAFAMAASILLRCALLLTIDNSEPRYTLEFFPVLLVWAGAICSPRPAILTGTAAAQSE